MKKEFKYFIAGFAVCLCLTGSIVSASSDNPIVKVIENVKFMFDGVEKKVTDESLIYNDRIYVPIRFVADGTGKDVHWDQNTETVWIGKYEGAFDYLNELSFIRNEGLDRGKYTLTSKKYVIANETYLHGIMVSLRGQVEGSLTFDLSDKYKSLSGYVGIEDFTWNSNNVGSVIFYNDGIEVHRVDQIVGGEEAIAFSLSVEDTSKLKIVFQSTIDTKDQIQISIVEPKLIIK